MSPSIVLGSTHWASTTTYFITAPLLDGKEGNEGVGVRVVAKPTASGFNQPGFIDDASNSRFHLIIEYPRLNQEQRSNIWQNFLHKIHHDQEQHNQPTKIRIKVLSEVQNYLTTNTDVKALELNGRGIRNAFNTAIQIVIYRTDTENRYWHRGIGQPMTDVYLTVDDIKKVIDNKTAY
ncbi:hypothetical protein N7463_003625 [Penicillium fimorum]|uniref:AAA+ ATPase lid domain-containing protein n=1 Tax=Penicillium fimorum TaxID=1882269 RepID=A0A9W9Y1K7_9EURO|nr:hypothetical protein N7463_003625 [Penicillium fimorum]